MVCTAVELTSPPDTVRRRSKNHLAGGAGDAVSTTSPAWVRRLEQMSHVEIYRRGAGAGTVTRPATWECRVLPFGAPLGPSRARSGLVY
jgi:hypothetical protein